MKLVSWNIQYCKGVDGKLDPARIVATALGFADADIFCFQEVADHFAEDDADQPAALAALLPGYTPVYRPALDLGRRRFGNMIFSRLPVLQTFPHILPRPVEPGGRSMQRMALEVVVEAPWGPLRVTTTHLEYFSADHRRAQIERILAIQKEAAAREMLPDAPVTGGTYGTLPHPGSAIVCGDFNCGPETPEFGRMLGFFRDSWTLAHPGQPHPLTAGLYDTEQWAEPKPSDYVFVTPDLAPRLRRVAADLDTAASDHQPVLVELE